jgi:hypothetical protein
MKKAQEAILFSIFILNSKNIQQNFASSTWLEVKKFVNQVQKEKLLSK